MEDIGDLEELKTLGPKRNLAEELYRRIGPFDFDKNQARVSEVRNSAAVASSELNKDQDLEFKQIVLNKGQKYYG